MASTQAAIEEANIIYCAIHSLSHPNSDKTITAINNALLLGVTQQDITDRVTMARNVNFQNMTYNPVTGGGSADMTANLSLLKNEIVNGNVICCRGEFVLIERAMEGERGKETIVLAGVKRR